MKRTILLLTILVMAGCTTTSEPAQPASNTDPIAGYWSGTVSGRDDSGQDLPPTDVGILIIAGCTSGKVCGKFSEDEQCPGDIILMEVDGNRYRFLSETASGSRHACGAGGIRMMDLELRPDGMLEFNYHNGATLSGIILRY